MQAEIRVREALPADNASIRDMLEACGLPAPAMAPEPASGYAVAESGDRLVGVAGVEIHGSHGLLRSVAILPAWRGLSVGRRLVRDRLAWARASGLADVFLLTTDAAGYFERLGFKRVGRDRVPPEVRASEEFARLCPSSATAMMMEALLYPGERSRERPG
jgi:amino-acid N-acetyltransferase